MTATSSPHSPHGADWGQRLEEWRDGLASGADATAIETHVASCDECQDYLEALEQIDAALSSTLHISALSADFDLQLWSRIGSSDDIQRTLAKQRAQEQMQQELAALTRNWRRRVALMIPGLLAGIAIAFWFASLVNGSDAMTTFATLLQQKLGVSTGQLVQSIVTGLLGGAVGMAMSQWIVPTSD
jgi:anti-sigma factor RsiW